MDSSDRSRIFDRHLIDPARQAARQLAAALERSLPAAVSFPGYDIVGEIHRGGQGVVYRAFQRSTHRDVAIKVMHESALADASTRARFEREVQILGQFRHPNIVAIHDSGTAQGRFFYVMDCIHGLPLDRHLEVQPRSVRGVFELFVKICEAVNAAHLRGVIHRDLKPG
ncbi:MAG: serine/threonine protein kinase, partial [Planctomycetes bacterium]|nr:serine/threonine protein kinase [Planctomycetota bacterium]